MPSFIKIDVEGYELEVMNGLNQKVPLLSFEYITPELTDKIIPIYLNYNRLEIFNFIIP